MSMQEKKTEKNLKREISAGFVVFRRTKDGVKFLVLYHRGSYWNFPKGKIESEEKSLAAAFRETREETGLGARDLRLLGNFRAYQRYYFKQEGQPIYKIVIFYLAESRSGDVRLSREHSGYGWFLFRDAQKILNMAHHRDSLKVLREANDFLRPKSTRHRSPHPAR